MPAFLSGKIDVFQVVMPISTTTGKEPQPRENSLNLFCISAESFFGTVTKCQAAVPPGYSQTATLNEYCFLVVSFFKMLCFLYFVTPNSIVDNSPNKENPKQSMKCYRAHTMRV